MSASAVPGKVVVVVTACLLVMSLLASHAHAQQAEVSLPWGWECESQYLCVKKDATENPGLMTLNTCKLTCTTDGFLWPMPTSSHVYGNISMFLVDNIAFEPTCLGEVCNMLQEAFVIFKDNLQRYHPAYSHGKAPWRGPWDASTLAHTLYVAVSVSGEATHLELDTDESYELTVTTAGDVTTAAITAPTYFGARHGLETLSQLVDYHETADSLMVVTATVTDKPVFPYRGLLLDTSRNYVSLATLERTLDGMAANKLNTLHWHITDTHSFPLVLEGLPNMANYGAYSASEVYTTNQIADLKEYARVRGVRLLPELDAPAHVGNGWQWGEKEGLGQLAVCVNQEPWLSFCVEPPCGQLNLANPEMYNVLSSVYNEMFNMFAPLDMFHFGGDEVNINCWNSTQEIFDWMTENGYGVDEAAYYEQWAVFQEKARSLLLQAAGDDDVQGILFTSGLTAPEHLESYVNKSNYIIQIWSTESDPIIGELLNRGYRVIFSNYDAWYLDCGMGAWIGEGNNWCSPYKGWQKVYMNDPYKIASDQTGSNHEDLILGGEAALWTEQADDTVIDAKLWPRGAALAERLWSNPAGDWSGAEGSFIHHRQRLVKRGIQADRIQPQWCHQNDGHCHLSSDAAKTATFYKH